MAAQSAGTEQGNACAGRGIFRPFPARPSGLLALDLNGLEGQAHVPHGVAPIVLGARDCGERGSDLDGLHGKDALPIALQGVLDGAPHEVPRFIPEPFGILALLRLMARSEKDQRVFGGRP
jgi:hypothetical protein